MPLFTVLSHVAFGAVDHAFLHPSSTFLGHSAVGHGNSTDQMPGVTPGSMGKPHPASADEKTIVGQVQEATEVATGKHYQEFDATTCCTQVVAGVNYFCKVNVGSNDCVHIRVFQPLGGGDVALAGVEQDKNPTDEITYIDEQ
mmetsp:Transcript_31044/g.65862  ORF Transcript_31044/g.65862 Transcript_31044/m.65862 type:complete len:143 (+) Transcript_31044:77-505(+)